MEFEVVVGGGGRSDDLRRLRSSLLDQPEFAGRVQMRERRSGDGELGPTAEALMLVLAGGSGAAVLTSTVRALGNVLVTWLRLGTGPTEVIVRRPDGGEIIVNSESVKGLSADKLGRILDEMTARLTDSPDSPPALPGSDEPPNSTS